MQQAQSLSAQQQQPLKSIDNPIKMVDIYATKEKIKQSVINEIEDQIIKPDADSKVKMITLDQEQAYICGVKLFDTFRGSTEFNLFNLCSIMIRVALQVSDIITMKTIMFCAQTAIQIQNNGQKYQDDMKDNPKSQANIKRKRQKSIKFQIEEEKVIEAYITHWQEQEKIVSTLTRQSQDRARQMKNFRAARRRYQSAMAASLARYQSTMEQRWSDDETDDEQDHAYRHEPGYWESVD